MQRFRRQRHPAANLLQLPKRLSSDKDSYLLTDSCSPPESKAECA